MPRTVNDAGFALIQHFEDCHLKSYKAVASDPWTVGWGHTGPDVREGLVWTQVLADQWLECDVQDAAVLLEKHVTAELSDNQFAALASFVFNVGPGDPAKGKSGFVRLANGKPSSLLRALNRGDFKAAALEFPKWNKAGGHVLRGLTLRRKAEQDLFRS